MGYRERRAHKQQQKQQSLGQSYTPEQRVFLPAPTGTNNSQNKLELTPRDALLMTDCAAVDGGVKIYEAPKARCTISSTSAQPPNGFISYYASGSSSAEFWLVAGSAAHRITNFVDGDGTATASVDISGIPTGQYDYVEFNKTIIMVNGNQGNYKWNRASAWQVWSASFSGSASAGNIWGLNKFKSRVFAWERNDTKFWYSSVDQFLGTFNPFELGGIINGNLLCVTTLTRDGGAGPDDYIMFISDQGDVAVYAGTDPADANTWSLVGVYKIGKPLARGAHINYASQTVVLCEDDFYFLPQDFSNEKTPTTAASFRSPSLNNNDIKPVHYKKDGLLIFNEGTALSTKRNLSFSTVTLTSATAFDLRSDWSNFHGEAALRPVLGEFKGRVFVCPDSRASQNDSLLQVKELFTRNTGATNAQIRTAPIKLSGRTNISLVNPIFGLQPDYTATTSSEMRFVYKTAIVYDQYRRPFYSADPSLFVTSTASANSEGLWTPGFGTGNAAQVFIDVLSVSSSAGEVYLYGIDLTLGDTGGI